MFTEVGSKSVSGLLLLPVTFERELNQTIRVHSNIFFSLGTAYQDAVKDWSDFVAPESKGGAGMRCIVVCPAYRLNVFGFLSVPEQDGHTDGKGNFGFFDQRAALEWTHRFASSLRGNPDNISVSGLSAGAQSAHAQVLYEFDRSQHDDAYRPIIKRILLRSGTAMVPCREASEAREGFLELCEKLDISANTDEARLTALREVPASDIVKAIPKMKLHTFRPVLDGGVAQGGFVSSTAGINMQKGVFSQWCKRNGITFILSEAANEEEIYKLINYPKKAPWKAELIRELYNYYPARLVEALLEAYDLPADDETDPKAWVHSFGEVSTDAQVYSAERLLYKYLVRPDIGGLNQEDVLRARLERRAAVYDDAFPKWMGVFHGCEDTLYGFNRPMIQAATNRAEAVRDLSAFIDFLEPFKGWLAGVSSQQTWDQWLKAPGKALDSGQTTAIVRVLRSNGEIELEEDIRASDKAKAMRALESTIVAPR